MLDCFSFFLTILKPKITNVLISAEKYALYIIKQALPIKHRQRQFSDSLKPRIFVKASFKAHRVIVTAHQDFEV